MLKNLPRPEWPVATEKNFSIFYPPFSTNSSSSLLLFLSIACYCSVASIASFALVVHFYPLHCFTRSLDKWHVLGFLSFLCFLSPFLLALSHFVAYFQLSVGGGVCFPFFFSLLLFTTVVIFLLVFLLSTNHQSTYGSLFSFTPLPNYYFISVASVHKSNILIRTH